MRKAIISGSTGFIGTHLCEELVENNIEVIALVRKDSSNILRLPAGVQVVNCGMDDYDALTNVQADVFYHLAWEGATGIGRDNEELQAKNVMRTISALKAAKRVGCNKFVGLGTVYEKLVDQVILCSEHRKADFYLLSKLNAHQMCLKLSQKLDIEFVWATIFQPIGKYLKREQIMYYTVEKLLNGEAPSFGPAMEPYDITAVEDIAYGLRLLGERDLSKDEYYIGSGNPRLLIDYLKRIKEQLKTDTKLNIGARPDDGMRFSFDWFDISNLVFDTGYSPQKYFETALENLVKWIKEN